MYASKVLSSEQNYIMFSNLHTLVLLHVCFLWGMPHIPTMIPISRRVFYQRTQHKKTMSRMQCLDPQDLHAISKLQTEIEDISFDLRLPKGIFPRNHSALEMRDLLLQMSPSSLFRSKTDFAACAEISQNLTLFFSIHFLFLWEF